MSVKFQDKIQEQVQGQLQGQFQEKIQEVAEKSIRQDTKELVHKVGERLTGGNAQNGYLAVCLSSHPQPSAARVAQSADMAAMKRCTSVNYSATLCAQRC
jgi:hypothetical protein